METKKAQKPYPFLEKLEEKIEQGKRPDAPNNKIKRFFLMLDSQTLSHEVCKLKNQGLDL